MAGPIHLILAAALAAAALTSACRVHDRSAKCAIAWMVNKKAERVGMRHWAASWAYVGLTLVLAAAAGWLAGRA